MLEEPREVAEVCLVNSTHGIQCESVVESRDRFVMDGQLSLGELQKRNGKIHQLIIL